MVNCEAIVRSVQVYWRDEFTAAPTIYAGQRLDTAGLAAWVELWVDATEDIVRRDGSADQQSVWLTVHCFSRDRQALTLVNGVAASARSAIARRLIAVRDFEQSGDPIIARLRTREADVRDLTRIDDDEQRGVLRHLVVTCRGRLEEVAA